MAAKPVRSDQDHLSQSRLLNCLDAIDPHEPCTLQQAIAMFTGLSWKDDVVVGMTSNVTLTAPGATLDGITMVSGMRVLLMGQTSQPANGIYQWNGASSTMTRTTDANTNTSMEGAVVNVDQGTNAGTQWRQTQTGITLGTSNVIWASNGSSAPAATESTAGIAAVATQTETNTGTIDTKMVTPLKLANFTGFVRKKTFASIGDGSSTQIDLTHNLGTFNITAKFFVTSTKVMIDDPYMVMTDNNTLRSNFSAAPTSSELSCTIFG